MSIKYGYDINLKSDSTASKVVRLVGENKKVLEFGCSYGYMSKVIKDNFKGHITGVEMDTEAAEQARDICDRIIVGNIEKLNFDDVLKNEVFDVVIFADVLEHLSNPWEILIKIRDYLSNDGYIIASIPNISYLSVVMELIQGEFRYRDLGILDNTHLRFFTKESIIAMFESSGYYIESIDCTKVPIEISEFKTGTLSFSEEQLDFLKKKNSDWDTYQFIIKAYKASEPNRINILKEKILKLEDEIKSKNIEKNTIINNLEMIKGEFHKSQTYNHKLEKDIQEIRTYNDKLEKDIQEIRTYNDKLEKDIKEIRTYNEKLEKDIQLIDEYKKELELEILNFKKHNIFSLWKNR